MGIDLKAGGRQKSHNKTVTRSPNLYIHLLLKLYKFLARRTDSKFCATMVKRLCQSRLQRAPLSLSKLAKNMKGKESRIAVVVGTVTDDIRLLDLPKLKVCALRFTEGARARIVKAGGECITFDELVMKAPTGSNVVLLRGPKDREAKKHFGPAPGVPHSHTKPYTVSRNSERRN